MHWSPCEEAPALAGHGLLRSNMTQLVPGLRCVLSSWHGCFRRSWTHVALFLLISGLLRVYLKFISAHFKLMWVAFSLVRLISTDFTLCQSLFGQMKNMKLRSPLNITHNCISVIFIKHWRSTYENPSFSKIALELIYSKHFGGFKGRSHVATREIISRYIYVYIYIHMAASH